MPRFRFSIRRMMVGVAIAGLVIATLQRSAYYRERYRRYFYHSISAESVQPDRLKWYDDLARKYYFAMWFPWLPVEPDPPYPSEPLFPPETK